MVSDWCTEGDHEVREEVVYIGKDYLSGDQTCSRYACPACVQEHGLVPPVSPFVGHRDTPPEIPGESA